MVWTWNNQKTLNPKMSRETIKSSAERRLFKKGWKKPLKFKSCNWTLLSLISKAIQNLNFKTNFFFEFIGFLNFFLNFLNIKVFYYHIHNNLHSLKTTLKVSRWIWTVFKCDQENKMLKIAWNFRIAQELESRVPSAKSPSA